MAYQNTTLATLQTRLAERYEGSVFWTADQSRRAINEGLRIWNLITGTWRTARALTTVPNDPYLFVGGSVTKVTRVRMGTRVLAQSSLFGFDFGRHGWEAANTGSGGIHPTQVTHWAPVGLTVIALYPADQPPGQSAITVDGVVTTTVLVNAGDFLDLGDEEINTLLGYALHVLSFAKGAAALQKTQPLRVAFYKAAASRNAVFAASSLYRKLIGWDQQRFAKLIQLPPDPAAQQVIDATAATPATSAPEVKVASS